MRGLRFSGSNPRSGTSKLKTLPIALKRTMLSPSTAITDICPPEVCRVPVLATTPPIKLRFASGAIDKLPALTIAPGLAVANSRASGDPSKFDQLLLPTTSNQLFSPNPTLVAVVAVKSAGTFNLALAPNAIPAGLTRKRLASPPETCSKPSI